MTKLFSKTLLAFFFVFCFAVGGFAQSKTPADMADQFIKAWNSHDMKLFNRLFADDAVWVPVAETRIEGRDNIVKDIGSAHTSRAKTTTVRQTGMIKVQKLRRDAAVVFFISVFSTKMGN
ncbi:MAG TPA: SgcJ/EcaC family oxidoreductase [Pyrinomonadaceae bacterium]|nr:SgcJ/EcaC family oxidoreductase [Pyrinomonadaceae bacterium]